MEKSRLSPVALCLCVCVRLGKERICLRACGGKGGGDGGMLKQQDERVQEVCAVVLTPEHSEVPRVTSAPHTSLRSCFIRSFPLWQTGRVCSRQRKSWRLVLYSDGGSICLRLMPQRVGDLVADTERAFYNHVCHHL